ncbi:EAL domain-containing protein [Sporolactobacillus sp. THM7-7]|nr:EAL domain-containing protein [Sporolactobacillus sp. THM7-7]
MDTLLNEEGFFHYFQPIKHLGSQETVGYEALFRSRLFANPEDAFIYAKKNKQLYELDSRSIRKAASTYRKAGILSEERKLFLNVYPSTVLNAHFPSLISNIMDRILSASQSLVLEIVENEAIEDFKKFKKVIRELRQNGVRIAIDDFSKGIDDINRTIEIDTDYIKLDRYFSRELSQSRKKQAYIRLLVQFCSEFQITLIMEGLETPEEIEMAREMGIHYAQGFGLGRPGPLWQS